jgi:5'-3' exonuclease
MNPKELIGLLNQVQENTTIQFSERILLIDAMNLFFRNFAVINSVDPTNGNHVGGLGGFLRSLGSLVNQLHPTQVYVVFDGIGSSNNRKNLLPEYKSNRNLKQITNWEIFESFDEENESKINQISRLIQYLKILPLKVVSIDKTEADDVIAYYSKTLISNPDDRIFIVSNDKDYIQLISDNVILYQPTKKEYLTSKLIYDKFKLPIDNFIIYKTLTGDNSDQVKGIKGLGEKNIHKLFPEISTKVLSLADIYDISSKNLDKNVIYARIIQDFEKLEIYFKIMNLQSPMIQESDKTILDKISKDPHNTFIPERFIMLHKEDKLEGLIKNAEFWVRDTFSVLNTSK